MENDTGNDTGTNELSEETNITHQNGDQEVITGPDMERNGMKETLRKVIDIDTENRVRQSKRQLKREKAQSPKYVDTIQREYACLSGLVDHTGETVDFSTLENVST